MSCDNCMYAAAKAGCNFSYACNTTDRPIAKQETATKREKKSRDKVTKEQP